jgi:hypothetical protein
VEEFIVARVAGLVGGAARNAFGQYRRRPAVRYLAWRAEQRHALAAVEPDVWDELDLEAVLDVTRPAQQSSYPSALGRQLWVVFDSARYPDVGVAARRALDIAEAADPVPQRTGINVTLNALTRLARPLVLLAPPDELAALVDHAVALDAPTGYEFAYQVEAAQAASSPRVTVDLGKRRMQFQDMLNAHRSDYLRWTADVQADPKPVNTGTHVNVGFVDAKSPRVTVRNPRLDPDTLYWLWVGVGPHEDEALAGLSEPIVAERLVGADEIDVAVFPDAPLAMSPTPTFGTLAIRPSGAFPVLHPALELAEEVGEVAAHRLFFGLRTPTEPGAYRVRCGIFVRGLLVHVEQVTVAVGDTSATLAAATIFRLTRELSSATLGAVADHRLSVYLNADADGSHTLTFFGRDGTVRFTDQTNLDARIVRDLLRDAREALHVASWGGGEYAGAASRYEPSSPGQPFADIDQVEEDLVRLARAGNLLWQAFAEKLTTSAPALVDEFAAITRTPGLVQLALREDPDLIIPLQLLYDRYVQTSDANPAQLCSATRAWLATPTDALPCLDAICPDADNPRRVCAASFWGFRHAISVTLPRSTDCGTPTLHDSAPAPARPAALIGLTTDSRVTPYLKNHLETLGTLFDVQDRADYVGVTTELKLGTANVVYFLCHVRYDGAVPVIIVGPDGGDGIDATTLQYLKPNLCQGQPLVFLNACDSAAASPDRMLGLVDHFFSHGASTAIGTEITVFVSLAVPFAENVLRHVAGRIPLAESIRRARVTVLSARNPLGLAYLAFGMPQFTLTAAT